MRTLLLLLSLLVSGCFTDLFAQGDALVPDSDTYAAASSTGEPETPTTSLDTDVQTVTGEEITTTEPGSGTGSPANVPPVIDVFDGIPDHISEAGPVFLQLLASADVTAVQLSLDETILAEGLEPAQFPWTHEFLSAADNGPARIFKVVVEDDEGLTAEAQATVSVQLPVSGAQKCLFEEPERGAVISGISAVKYTAAAIYAVGLRDSGAGPRLSAWKLDPDTCELASGWPRTLLDWTADPALGQLASVGAAVDVDVDGNLVVGGNLVGVAPRGYVALLDASGEQIWEHAGAPGDEVMGVAAATGQFKNRVFVVGSRRTDDNPVRTDGAIWVYQADLDEVFVGAPTILGAPFTANEVDPNGGSRSEWVRAVVLDPDTGNALAVGEREFRPNVNFQANRAFTVLVHPLGEVIGAPWTSPADNWFFHDAARSVAICSEGFVAGGWTRDDLPGAEPQPMIFWIDPDGTSEQQRPEPQLAPSQTHGIACDRLGKIVSAGTRTVEPADAQVFMVDGPEGPRTTYEAGVQGDDGAAAVACDARGFCSWGGHRTVDAKPYAVVRVHHP